MRPCRPSSSPVGYVGMYAALRVQRELRRGEARITLIEPRPNMTYQPVPVRGGRREPRTTPRGRFAASHVEALRGGDGEGRPDRSRSPGRYGRSVGRTALRDRLRRGRRCSRIGRPDIADPRLADMAIGFKQIEEAIARRNRVLERLDTASSEADGVTRRRTLTFLVVGGGYAGVEALAELEDMARYACRYYDDVAPPTCAGCWSRRVTGSCPRSVRTSGATPSTNSGPAASRCCCRRGWSRASAVTSCCQTARPSTPTRSCGPPGSSPTRFSPTLTYQSTTRGPGPRRHDTRRGRRRGRVVGG